MSRRAALIAEGLEKAAMRVESATAAELKDAYAALNMARRAYYNYLEDLEIIAKTAERPHTRRF